MSTPKTSKTRPAADEKKPERIEHKGQVITLYRGDRKKSGKVYESFTLYWIANGIRHRKVFASEEKARLAAKELARQLSEGTGHAHAFTLGEMDEARAALRVLHQHPKVTLSAAVMEWHEASRHLPEGASLAAAAKHYAAFLSREKLPSMTVESVADEFVVAKDKAGASTAYLALIKKLLPRIKNAFRCPIESVRTSDLQTFVDGIKLAPRSRENYRRAIMTLWNFAKRRGYLPRDHSTEADHLEPIKHRAASVAIYAPDAMQKAMQAAPDNVRVCLALAAFAGLRTAEISRLEWSDIGGDYVTVQAEKAKTGARRLVPILPALRTCLPKGSPEGRVSPFANDTHLSRALSDCFRAAGLAPVKNGLRHSFCSYRIAIVKSAPQVALEAGNSPQVIFQSYRELVTEDDAVAWFSVTPATPANVVKMPRRKCA